VLRAELLRSGNRGHGVGMSTALEQVWHGLAADLRRYLVRRIGDEAEAEDVLQETFLKLHRHLAELDEERVAPWVYRVARNAAVDHRRRRARTPRMVDSTEHDEGPAEPQSDRDEEGNVNVHVASWLRPMLSELPEPYREALELTEFEGLTQQQLAERLGLSLSGAKSRVQRGRLLLKQVVERCCALQQDRRGNVLDYVPRPDCCATGAALTREAEWSDGGESPPAGRPPSRAS
jgi:RNA polymerase sigma-70 factor (ECF subfamily)